jgi:hypothetical protein
MPDQRSAVSPVMIRVQTVLQRLANHGYDQQNELRKEAGKHAGNHDPGSVRCAFRLFQTQMRQNAAIIVPPWPKP